MRPQILGPMFAMLFCATAALAQVTYQPTPPPDTSAADKSWLLDGDPIPFAGDLYYQTRSIVYFNGYRMVPTGAYDGVTLYADTTVEPYSIVLIPVGGQMVRIYERPRTGNLAGTSGSTVSGLPPSISNPDVPRELASDQRSQRGARRRALAERQPPPPPQPPPAFEAPQGGLLAQTARKPQDNLGIWVMFQGYRWEQSGEAVELDTRLTRVGDYHGFPVYADARTPYVIYLPLRGDLVTPFRRSAP